MARKYMDHLYDKAQQRRGDRNFIAQQYNAAGEERFKSRSFHMFRASIEDVIRGAVIGYITLIIFKIWAIWSIVSFIFSI